MKKLNFNNETEFVFSNEFIGFTTIPNYILNDTRISYKSLGLYCQILQFQNSPKHSLYQTTLKKLKKDGKDSISTGINELIKYGYLKKEQLTDENGRFCGIKYVVFMKPKIEENSININTISENGFSAFGKTESGKSETKNKMNKKENVKKENISLSKEKKLNEKLKKYLEKYNKTEKEIFKIEIEKNNNELNNIIVDIINNLLLNKKNININKKEVNIDKVIQSLKELDKQNINKLINHVAKKFESINKDNITNKSKYIISIFINSIFEKSYLLDNIENKKNNYNYYKSNQTNKFINFDQPKVDFKKLRELELKELMAINENNLINEKYKKLIIN